MKKVSVVVYSWNRNDNHRMYHFLSTLVAYQSFPPEEVIIVDNSSNVETAMEVEADIKRFIEDFKGESTKIRAFFLEPIDNPYKAWAMNYGARQTREDVDYLLFTDIDMVFPPDWLKDSIDKLGNYTFLLSEPSRLPKSWNKMLDVISWDDINWEELYKLSEPWGKAKGPGNGQFMPREWFFNVHGYNEIFSRGQDGLDMDIWRRAAKAGLDVKWQYRDDNKFLHLWHPISEWKGKNHRFMNVQYNKRDPDVIVNLDGWGESK